jgi:hypothetical protein
MKILGWILIGVVAIAIVAGSFIAFTGIDAIVPVAGLRTAPGPAKLFATLAIPRVPSPAGLTIVE